MMLVGADVGVLWFYVVEETREIEGKHRLWTGDHYPNTCLCTRAAAVTTECFTTALSTPFCKFVFRQGS